MAVHIIIPIQKDTIVGLYSILNPGPLFIQYSKNYKIKLKLSIATNDIAFRTAT